MFHDYEIAALGCLNLLKKAFKTLSRLTTVIIQGLIQRHSQGAETIPAGACVFWNIMAARFHRPYV